MGRVTYPSRISAFVVIGESEHSPSPLTTYSPNDNVLGNRILTHRADRTLWAATGLPPGSGTARIEGWGWLTKNDDRVKFGAGDGPWIGAGRANMIQLDQFVGGWAPLSFSTVTPVLNVAARVGVGPSDVRYRLRSSSRPVGIPMEVRTAIACKRCVSRLARSPR